LIGVRRFLGKNPDGNRGFGPGFWELNVEPLDWLLTVKLGVVVLVFEV